MSGRKVQGSRRSAPRKVTRACPEAEAWVRVAKLLADPTHLMPFGLCSVALDVENGHTHLFFRMRDRARDHVIALHGQEGSCYAYPRGEEREARILASLWMALEAAEECR